MRRDATCQAHDPAFRGAPRDRQRHRMLLDLGRLKPFLPLHCQCQGRRAGMGELALRGQRRIWLWNAAGLPAAQGLLDVTGGGCVAGQGGDDERQAPAALAAVLGHAQGEPARLAAAPRPQHLSPDDGEVGAFAPGGEVWTRKAPNVVRLAGHVWAHQLLDCWRRRLGIRHRLRRLGPRDRQRGAREYLGVGYGDVQQHRWPGFEGHASWCHGQVCGERQEDGEEGPVPVGHDVQDCLRGLDLHAREPSAGRACHVGGRCLPRAERHRGLFAVHQSRLSYGREHPALPDGRGQRVLAALSVQPRVGRQREQPLPARQPKGQGRPLQASSPGEPLRLCDAPRPQARTGIGREVEALGDREEPALAGAQQGGPPGPVPQVGGGALRR
mmetsp:Transcript_65581/g.170291  ORF Transcript_65581/g.170291 Transcript_65581/m.170291 type:complete len:385 (+) Transcript_65581:1437-2591(+)